LIKDAINRSLSYCLL